MAYDTPIPVVNDDEERERIARMAAGGIPALLANSGVIPSLQRPNLTGKQEYNTEKQAMGFNEPLPANKTFSPEFFQQREAQNQFEKLHPWGSPVSAHPGTWGKIGHVLSKVGQVAGNALIPNVMEGIPGTEMNRAAQTQANMTGFQKSQQGETEKEKAENPPEVAAIKAEAEANKEQSKEAETEKQQDANRALKEKLQSEHEQFLSDLQNKKEALNPYELWAADPKTYDEYLAAQAKSKGAGRGSIMSPYAAVRMYDTAIRSNPAMLPLAEQFIKNWAAQNGMTLPPGLNISEVPAGQPRNEEGTPIGTMMPGAPTGQTRTAGQFADKALLAIPRIRPEINSLSKEIGPVSGRMAHFLVGDIGSSGDPQFDEKYSKLRTDITFLTSNAARFHLNSVRAVQEFLKLADAGKASAASLNGFIDGMEEWAKDAKKVGEGNQPENNNPPAGAKIRDYTQIGKQ